MKSTEIQKTRGKWGLGAREVVRLSRPESARRDILSHHDLFAGAGEMAARFRDLDWSRTPLGPAASWPDSLISTLGLVLSSALPMFIAWGPKRILLYNDAYSKLLGPRHPQALGAELAKTWSEVWPELEPLIQAADQGRSVLIEDLMLVVQRKGFAEDTYSTFSCSPIHGAGYRVRGLLCAVIETTASKKAELESKKSRENLKLALASAGMGAWQLDLRTNNVATNFDCAEILGVPEINEDIFSAIARIVHPEDIENLNLAWMAAVEGDLPFDYECRIIRPDHQIRWVQGRGQVLKDLRGEPYQFAGVMADVTERKNSQNALEEAKKAAESANLAKSNFLANVSHEIRTPLGIIQGFAELLNGEKELAPAVRSAWISTIGKNAFQLTSLIDELLDLSKIEAEKLEINPRMFDISEVQLDIAKLLVFKAKNKGIRLRIHADGLLPRHLIADPSRLRQILINVIGNAIKFTSQGGVDVRVQFRHDEDGQAGQLEYLIQDTGLGIKPGDQDHLFKPFAQADGSITRKFGGTGLGLYISRRLAQAMGGDLVLVESQVETGSTFRLTVACATARPVAEHSQYNPAAPEPLLLQKPLAGLSILLVEDSPDNQELVTTLLVMSGARVEVAGNGHEGVRKALGGDHSVVLMDLQMPELDGYAATKKLRRAGFAKPIIALTAHAMLEERERCLLSGFDDHVTKPVKIKILVDAISSQLRGGQTLARERSALIHSKKI